MLRFFSVLINHVRKLAGGTEKHLGSIYTLVLLHQRNSVRSDYDRHNNFERRFKIRPVNGDLTLSWVIFIIKRI